jgi:hypothetical protein
MKPMATLRVMMFVAMVVLMVSCGGAPSREQELQATVGALQTQIAGQSAPAPTSGQAAGGAPSREPPGATELPPAPAQSAPTTLAPTSLPPRPVIALLLLEMTRRPSESKGVGWSDITLRFAAENQGGKPFYGYWPPEVKLQVKEGFSYPLRSKGADMFHNVSNNPVVIAPGFRVLAPQYVATIGESTHPNLAYFDTTAPDRKFITAVLNVENPVGGLSFPTDKSSSELAPLPDVIETPGQARLTVVGFAAIQAMNIETGGGGRKGRVTRH